MALLQARWDSLPPGGTTGVGLLKFWVGWMVGLAPGVRV